LDWRHGLGNTPNIKRNAAVKLPFALSRPLAFLDLETTGLSIFSDRIVELAVIRISPQGDVLEAVRRFNPGMPIPAEATAVHGISDADVAGEQPFAARAKSLAELLDSCDLGGFNIRRFDLPVLMGEFRRAGVPFSVTGRRLIDAQVIFHREEPRDLSAAARFYLDREHEEAHTALGDIRTTAAVLTAQIQRYSNLPRDLDGLHAYCDEVSPFQTEMARWFQRRDPDLVFRRGKHRGETLSRVASEAPDYLRWMLGTEDMDEEVLQVVRDALEHLS
jgi:DNA polymerase III subunit epsilon